MAVRFVKSREAALEDDMMGFAKQYSDQLAEKQKSERANALMGFQAGQELQKQGYQIGPEDYQKLANANKSGDINTLTKVFGEIQQRGYRPEIQEGLQYKKDLKKLNKQKMEAEIAELNRPYQETKEGKKFKYQEQLKSQYKKDEKNETNLAPIQKLAGLNAESKNKIASIASGISALKGMVQSVSSGQGPQYVDVNTPLVGQFMSDTEFTRNQRVLDEVVARLQSGGAINPSELKNFRDMGPRPSDNPSVASKKLEDQMMFLENKAAAFGFDEKSLSVAGLNVGSQTQPVQNNQSIEFKKNRLMKLRAKAGIQ